MRVRGLWQVFLAVALVFNVGCCTKFSSEWGRREIRRQTGVQPRNSFEFQLEEATMNLAKTVVSKVAGEPVNFGGLTRIDVAVYKLPPGRRLDFDRISHRGWDKLISTHEEKSNIMILVRTNGDRLADLVVMAQGEEQVLYGRLKGNLSPDLPSTLQSVLQATGLKGLKEHLLSEAPAPAPRRANEPPPAEKKR
jgi:hypothetical protein